jgi:hypothetical protein
MTSLSQPSSRIPLLLGALGIAVLLALFVVPAVVRDGANWPHFAQYKSGCQEDRRTLRHTGGAALGGGSYAPCLIDTGMGSGEPGLAITNDGTLMRSVTMAPAGIAVSSDNGVTWTRRVLPKDAKTGIPDGYLDQVTQRYFYTALGDTPAYFSDDEGLTWQTGTFDSGERYDWNRVFSGRPVMMRQGGYPANIYYCNMTQPGGFVTGARCFKSVDGGKTFKTSGADPFKQGDCKDPTQPRGSGVGRGIVDPQDGAIYMPIHFCGATQVVVSRNEGSTWTHQPVEMKSGSGGNGVLKALASPAWRKQLMNGRINVVPAEMAESQNSDALAMDAAGRLYFVWNDEGYLPVLSWSADKGKTWSKPLRINPPAVVQSVMTAIAVAPDGRVGISYYGTEDKQVWTGYLAISDNPTAPVPTFETAAVTRTGEPLMPEACCWASGPQEYTIARWAPDGSLWGAFAATVRKGDARGMLGRLVRR